jgi:hypothetical protein
MIKTHHEQDLHKFWDLGNYIGLFGIMTDEIQKQPK